MEVITTEKFIKRIHHKYCDNCKVELTGGFVYLFSPVEYIYNCPKCGEVYTSDKVYPWTEIIGEEDE